MKVIIFKWLMKLIALLLILLLLTLVSSHTYSCLFDKRNKDLREESKKAKPDVAVHPSG